MRGPHDPARFVVLLALAVISTSATYLAATVVGRFLLG